MGLNTSYLDTIGRSNYRERVKEGEPKEKVNLTVRNDTEYKAAPRHMAKSPRIEKDIKLSCIEIQGIAQDADPERFKRAFNRSGLKLTDVKFDKNPISHQNTGKGMLIVESSNPNDRIKVLDKLNQVGLVTNEKSNFHHKLK